MAFGFKRRGRYKGATTPIGSYTVTFAHEPSAECDTCGLPAPVLYEFEDGSASCELCSGSGGGDFLWRTAVLGGLYSGWIGGDGL